MTGALSFSHSLCRKSKSHLNSKLEQGCILCKSWDVRGSAVLLILAKTEGGDSGKTAAAWNPGTECSQKPHDPVAG